MSVSDCEVGQVIVVVEASSNEGTIQGSKTLTISPRKTKHGPEKKNQRKLVNWELLQKLPSTEAFRSWLKKKEAGGVKYTRKKVVTTCHGAKDFYACTGPGCPVQLEVLFKNSSEDVIISHNSAQHKHEEKPHSGWGLPEKTKKAVQQLVQAGITSTTEVDTRLRRLDHTNYTMKQLIGYLGRARRMYRHQEVVQEYSSLSVWGGGDRSSQDHRLGEEEDEEEEEEDSSHFPVEDIEFADSSPSASPARLPAASVPLAVLDRGVHRRQQTVMDEGTVRRLVESSLEARRHAYCPYSQFPVGAALLCPDGQIITGCNVENVSYGLTNCAERTAVFKAASEGRRQFTAVAIAAEMGDKFVGPCGACRQVLAEFNAEMPVILTKPNGQISRTSMKELLPNPFLPAEATFKK